MKKALRINVTGIVQGVGFRPFIYRLARRYSLKGYVLNRGGSEVEIWVEGEEKDLRRFIEDLRKDKPKPAQIYNINVESANLYGYKEFTIKKSLSTVASFSMIPPDIGICEYCLAEIKDENSRWYNYPFNSCAWCGPRFSMMYTIPYDRDNTSMRDFPLCDKCRSEYNDPNNVRRFHAQGISCPVCGPRLWLADKFGKKINVDDPLKEAAKLIDEGFIVGIKGIGGFHIASLSTNDEVVLKLRKRKKRPQKPFAIMALNVRYVKEFANITEKHIKILESSEKPIVLVPKKFSSKISVYVSPGLNTIGVMLPYSGIHYLLLSNTIDKFLIMTSGNMPGHPLIKDNKTAIKELSDIVDYFVLHNREIVNRVDDSVIRFTNRRISFLRRSRGYAPKWLNVPFKFNSSVIALGAYLSNVGSIGFERYIVPTQYIGDMDNLDNIDFLLNSLEFLMRNYSVRWDKSIIVSDLNPRYPTTILARRMASRYNVQYIGVQHHYAHLIATAIENGLVLDDEFAVGIAMDGVGLGSDGTVWGGEVMKVSFSEYHRIGHLDYITMPFGDISTKYPLLLLAGFLYEEKGEEGLKKFLKVSEKSLLPDSFDENVFMREYRSFSRTSSVGRFLELIATILGMYPLRTYEGELEMKLESMAYGGSLINNLKIEVDKNIILTRDFIHKILEKRNIYSRKDLAYTTLFRLGEALGRLAMRVAQDNNINFILVSGGAAVNDFIIKGIEKSVKKLNILYNKELPPGDGNISVGQVVTGYYRIAR